MRALYQARVMEHARRPRHLGLLAGATHAATEHNRLCGDVVTLSLRIDGARIVEVAFEGAGCALSTASASMLTDAIEGASPEDARRIQGAVLAMVEGPEPPAPDAMDALGELAALSSVRAFPGRARCVTLAWQALASALGEDGRPA
ncbi:MAG: SUF system NifU family Fe-S cluster assembly protein [Deltaproteobacteria bacterium]|nr:SUF system NifU family Fe-S cluster assembly protein [Deltaproteobacteria bacterium]